MRRCVPAHQCGSCGRANTYVNSGIAEYGLAKSWSQVSRKQESHMCLTELRATLFGTSIMAAMVQSLPYLMTLGPTPTR